MLAYAANRSTVGKRDSSPNALLLVISAHIAVVAVVMSAKMDLPARIKHEVPIVVDSWAKPPPQSPQPHVVPQTKEPMQVTPQFDDPIQNLKLPSLDPPAVDSHPGTDTLLGGSGAGASPEIPQQPATAPIRRDPRLLTPMSELKPPYPAAKLAAEQEATLYLRLTIDEQGRVTAVDPVGYADREFLAAARRYIIGHWRYAPASEDGRAISTAITITLAFRLDG
jgi:protein TonB